MILKALLFGSVVGPLALPSGTVPLWFPKEALAQADGWEAKPSMPAHARVRVSNRSKGVWMTISFEPSEMMQVPPAVRQALPGPDFSSKPLLLPIGVSDRVDSEAGRWRDVHVIGPGFSARCLLAAQPESRLAAGDVALQDRLLRGSVARVIGASANRVQQGEFRGVPVSMASLRGNTAPSILLGDWSRKLGITMKLDVEHHVLTLHRENRSVSILLGSKRVVVDRVNRDLVDVSGEGTQGFFIQREALQAIFEEYATME